MRPKTAILVLVVAVGLVALAAVLRAVLGGPSRPANNEVPESRPTESASATGANLQVNPNSSNTAAVAGQVSAVDLGKELDQIRELQANGAGDSTATAKLLTKVTNREREVRTAALDALRQLNDTNAIPALEEAVGLLQDPREKAAVMDVIDYLKLPPIGGDNEPSPGVRKAGEKLPPP
jgi:hypothetical protein